VVLEKCKFKNLVSEHVTILEILSSTYPELNWNFLNSRIPANYWDVYEHQISLFDYVAQALKIEQQQDWNSVTSHMVMNLHATPLLTKYNWSLLNILKSLYPALNWNALFWLKFPRKSWNSANVQTKIANLLQNILHIQNSNDWYRVSCLQIVHVVGRHVSRNNFLKLVKNIYPEEDWQDKKFSQRNKKARQRILFTHLKHIFKNEFILEDYHHKKIQRQLDIFLPRIGLALEFHGEQHYYNMPDAGFRSVEIQRVCDSEKGNLCAAHGIILCVIPFWWDNKIDSLVAMILKEFPVVFTVHGSRDCIPFLDQ